MKYTPYTRVGPSESTPINHWGMDWNGDEIDMRLNEKNKTERGKT